MNSKSVRNFSFGSLLILDELNDNYEYEIRLNLANKRKGIYLIQITDGTDEYNTERTYSVEVKAMYSTDTFVKTNGKLRNNT